MIRLPQFVLILSTISLLSCNSKTDKRSSDQPYHFSLRLPAGQKYYYTLTNETQTTATVNGKDIASGSTATLGLIYEFSKDTGANYNLKITYDKIRVLIKDKDNRTQEMDADKAATTFDPVEKLLGNLKGGELLVTINQKGEVLAIAGSKEIADRLMAGTNQMDVYSARATQQLLSQFAGELFVKNNLSQGFQLFPDSAIHDGDSWRRKQVQNADMSFESDARYTLTGINNGFAAVESDANITNVKTKNPLTGGATPADIQGSQTGNFQVDTATGLLMKEKTSTTLKGIMSAYGREVPITINLKREMSGKKL
jgi:hypothetical protein